MSWVYCTDGLPPVPPIDDAYTAPYVLVTTKQGEVCRGRPNYDIEDTDRGAVCVFIGWRTDGEGWDIDVRAWQPLPEPAKAR